MNQSLQEYGNLIADQCIIIAQELKNRFIKCIENTEIVKSEDFEAMLLMSFTFMTLFVVSGVWSNHKNKSLRRNLMFVTKNSIILKLASSKQDNQSKEDIAFKSVQIEFDHLKPYSSFHIYRMKEICKAGLPADSGTTLMISTEWIQSKMSRNDTEMNSIILSFAENLSMINKLETFAETMINSAKEHTKSRFQKWFFNK